MVAPVDHGVGRVIAPLAGQCPLGVERERAVNRHGRCGVIVSVRARVNLDGIEIGFTVADPYPVPAVVAGELAHETHGQINVFGPVPPPLGLNLF
ncbi:Uncharacterised protein [Mycobacteroides abscessus subsp. abscessus]|nr:Uncharacterised protein [Mycobacteroides abscessus subsp. abscessus]